MSLGKALLSISYRKFNPEHKVPRIVSFAIILARGLIRKNEADRRSIAPVFI
jgi:hypothetical protein